MIENNIGKSKTIFKNNNEMIVATNGANPLQIGYTFVKSPIEYDFNKNHW